MERSFVTRLLFEIADFNLYAQCDKMF